jgi:hypothetical protein
MRPNSFGRYLVIFFLITFILIFFVVKIFGGHKKPAPNPNVPVVKPLPEYADTYAEVSMTIDGRITGDDTHRQIRITVDRLQRRVDIIGGYNGNIIEEHSFDNNQSAYNVFLHAINNEGFTLKLKNTKYPADSIGQCPLGTRTIFELNDGGESLSNLWSSSCGTKIGTLGGSSSGLQTLFQAQITDYNKIVSKAQVQL